MNCLFNIVNCGDSMEIKLRKASPHDSKNVLDWRNEPTTIPWMGETRALSFDEHQVWFLKSLSDPHCLFFIIEADMKPIGQIRYHHNTDLIENTAKVSINIANEMHGKGVASIAFRTGSELVREFEFAKNIFAYVRPDNIGSIKAMENAGFLRDKTVVMHNEPHLIMIDFSKI